MALTTQIQPKILTRGLKTLREHGGMMADTQPMHPQHKNMLRQHKLAEPVAKNADTGNRGPAPAQHQAVIAQMGDCAKP